MQTQPTTTAPVQLPWDWSLDVQPLDEPTAAWLLAADPSTTDRFRPLQTQTTFLPADWND